MAVDMEPGPNPFLMLKRASRGDLEAQRSLADGAAACLAENDLCGFYEGLTYARMAAMNGTTADKGRLLSLLALAAHLQDPNDEAATTGLAGQYIAIATAAIDDDPAASLEFEPMVHEAIAQCSPAEIEQAKIFEKLLRAAEQGE